MLSLFRYAANGMLDMVDRNRKIKRAPERFQDTDKKFDVIVCCEARVFDQVTQGRPYYDSAFDSTRSLTLAICSGLEEREQETFEPVHVCNLEIKDNHESATLGALHIVSLCEMVRTQPSHRLSTRPRSCRIHLARLPAARGG